MLIVGAVITAAHNRNGSGPGCVPVYVMCESSKRSDQGFRKVRAAPRSRSSQVSARSHARKQCRKRSGQMCALLLNSSSVTACACTTPCTPRQPEACAERRRDTRAQRLTASTRQKRRLHSSRTCFRNNALGGAHALAGGIEHRAAAHAHLEHALRRRKGLKDTCLGVRLAGFDMTGVKMPPPLAGAPPFSVLECRALQRERLMEASEERESVCVAEADIHTRTWDQTTAHRDEHGDPQPGRAGYSQAHFLTPRSAAVCV